MVLPAARDLVLRVLGHLADQREVALRILLEIRGRNERRAHERDELLPPARIVHHVGRRIHAVQLAIHLVVLEDDRVLADRVHGVLRLRLPHRDRVRLTLHHRCRHRRRRRRHQRHVRFLQSRRAQHRHQVVVGRGVARHDDALALQVGETVDAGRALGDDAVVAVDQREQEPHVRVVAEHTQHLRGRVAGGMGALERDGPHAAVDDLETGAGRALIGDVDRRGLDDRHRDGDREHRVRRERRNRPLAGRNRRRRLSALCEQGDGTPQQRAPGRNGTRWMSARRLQTRVNVVCGL